MKNKIALTAIFAVLMTRTVLADTEPTPAISSGTTSAACESPAIGDATSGTVSYSAGWSNNVYTFDMFPDTSSQSSGVQNVCKFQDDNETTANQLVDNTSGSCNLTAGNFSKPSEIITGWLMEDFSNPGSITIPVPYGNSPITVNNIVDITNNATQQAGTGNEHLYNANLYANWGQCTANGSTPVLDTTDSKYKVTMTNGHVEVGTSNNNCQYTVSCNTGYEIASNPCNASGVTWNATNNTCTNSNLTLNTTIADCTSSVYRITLDASTNGGNPDGTLYEVYGDRWYRDPADDCPGDDTSIQCLPQSATPAVFTGYWTAASGGTKIINDLGDILVSNTTFTANTTLYAHFDECQRPSGGANTDTESWVAGISEENQCVWVAACKNGYTSSTMVEIGGEMVPGVRVIGNAAESTTGALPDCAANDISLTWDRNANDPEHDDMTNDSNNSCTYGAGANDEGHIVVPQPTREGYTFKGWYID